MTQIDFPNNPVLNDEFTVDKLIWKYDGIKWQLKNTSINAGPTGPTGPTGATGTSIKSIENIIIDSPQYNNTYNINLDSGTYILSNPSIDTFTFNNSVSVSTASLLITLPTSASSVTINNLWPNVKKSITIFDLGTSYESGGYLNNNYLVFSNTGVYISTDTTTWTFNEINNNAGSIRDAAYGNSLYAVVTNDSGILSSTDLITWTTRSTNQHVSVIYQNNQFTALNGVNSYIEVSTDGITWTSRTTGSFVTGYRIKYLNNGYIIGNSNGNIRTSTDTITWTEVNTGTTSAVRSFDYGNNKYVFGYADGTIRTSTDLVTWSSSGAIFTQTVIDIIYKYDVFIGLGFATLTTSQIKVSTDAVTWSTITNPNSGGMGAYSYIFNAEDNNIAFKSNTSSNMIFYNLSDKKLYQLYEIDGGA
jgi:hypothetical protein